VNNLLVSDASFYIELCWFVWSAVGWLKSCGRGLENAVFPAQVF
jgi:hypothetical protein